jgi:hypothetical protein
MFTIELRINGALIGHIYGRNVGVFSKDKCRYKYEYYEPENRGIIKGEIVHNRNKGIRALVCDIFKKVEKESKNNKS